ncbi:MAG: helix-turn-helix domain containing protein [Actinobacteria bacterium]|nr:helix-turn-helix domain containing protein [Actinomycetota bacterium]
MTSYRRTRSAILEGAKSMLAKQGLHKTSMIEIADEAEVSRATLYNHFRDKESVMRALLKSEVERIISAALAEGSPEKALAKMSTEISGDAALATLCKTDPAVLTIILTSHDDPLWDQVVTALREIAGGNQQLILRWLIGQFFAPVSSEESRLQALYLLSVH